MPESTLSLEICLPNEVHARRVMDWRNDKHTLMMFYHREPKRWEDFWPEFRDSYFSEPKLPPLFVLADGEPVAFLRYQTASHPEGDKGWMVDVSINVAPSARGRGLGVAALKLGSAYLKRFGVDCVLAEVRIENTASLRAFEATGFRNIGETEKHIVKTGERCRIVRFVQDLTPRYWRTTGLTTIADAGSSCSSGNSDFGLSVAQKMIDVASKSGADFINFQTFDFDVDHGHGDAIETRAFPSITGVLHNPRDLICELSDYCRNKGIGFMSAPSSIEEFEALDPYVEVHRLTSYEISDPFLLRLAGQSGKPLVLSIGANTEKSIAWAVETFEAAGGRDLALLLNVPASAASTDEINLGKLPWLKSRFGVAVGLSDQSPISMQAPLTAVGLGATVIKKRFAFDPTKPVANTRIETNGCALSQLIEASRNAVISLGDGGEIVSLLTSELSTCDRRGIQAIRQIAKGDVLRLDDNIGVLRPGKHPLGVHPRFLSDMVETIAQRALNPGEGLKLGDWGSSNDEP